MPSMVIAATLCSCQNDHPVTKPTDPRGEEYTVGAVAEISDSRAATLAGSHADFSYNVMSLIAPQNGNFVFSPLSIYNFLGLMANGADGATAKQIATAVGAQSVDEMIALCHRQIDRIADIDKANQAQSDMIHALYDKADEESGITQEDIDNAIAKETSLLTKIAVANSIWYDTKIGTPFTSYVDECHKWLDAKVAPVDFGKPETSAAINQWFRDKTNGLINYVVPENTPIFTEIVCTNALYLNAKWTEGMTKIDEMQEFKQADGSVVKADFIGQTKYLGYAENSTAQMVNIPLGSQIGNTYPMTFTMILPKNASTAPASILTPGNVKELSSNIAETYVKLSLPDYEIDTFLDSNELYSALTQLGMPDALNPDKANFSRMGNLDFHIVGIAHRSTIHVCESGVEAAAGTSNIWYTGSDLTKPKPKEVTFNRPFAFSITDNATGMLLFVGTVNKLND